MVGAALAARLRGRPAVVHVQAPESAAELLFLAVLRPLALRLVITAHNAVPHDRPGAGNLIHRATYRVPHLIVAQSEAEADVVRGLAGRRARVGVIAHGTYRPIADAFARSANGTGDAVRVAHLGHPAALQGVRHGRRRLRRGAARRPRACACGWSGGRPTATACAACWMRCPPTRSRPTSAT